MATLIANAVAGFSGTTGHAEVTIDSRGADFIIVAAAAGSVGMRGGVITDSLGNTPTEIVGDAFGIFEFIGAGQTVRYWRYDRPSTSASHTIAVDASGSGHLAIGVLAFAGAADCVFNALSSLDGNASFAVGSLTPIGVSLVVSFASFEFDDCHGTAVGTIDSGFTLVDQLASQPFPGHMGMNSAYLVQTIPAPINPTWSFDAGNPVLATVFGFTITADGDGDGGDDSPFLDGNPGPLAIATLITKDDVVRPFSDVDGQNNRGTYYGGRVDASVLAFKPISRALSGAQGAIEHVSFGATVSDTGNVLRAIVDDPTNKYLKNRPLIVRTVSDADRRAELPQHAEMCGFVTAYAPREDFQFDVDGGDWLKKKLSRKTQAPEYWQTLLTTPDFPQLPAALEGKAAPLGYGPVSDESDVVAIDDVPAALYPRGGFDPGWIVHGHHGADGTFPDSTWVYTWVTFIKDGVESTVTPGMLGYFAAGGGRGYNEVIKCGALPDLFRFYISDGYDFNPFTNPLGGTYARYIDVDPADIPEGNNPYPGPDPGEATFRFMLIDSPSLGEDYRALVSDGGGGTIDPSRGAWPTLYVGDETYGAATRSAFLVCRGAISAITSVFVGGQRVTTIGSAYELECPFLGDYASVFGANYRTINSRRWTVVYATGPTATNAINGSAPITVNATGYETKGDTTGVPITSPVRMHQHFARNFLAADVIPGEDWLTTTPLLPSGAPMLDDDSYNSADAVHQGRISGGYASAGLISVGGEYESAEDILATMAKDGDFDQGFSRQGSLMVSVEPAAAPSSPTTLDDVLHVLHRSFSVRTDPNQNFWNRFDFTHTKDYTGQTQTGWFLSGSVSDADSIENHEEENPWQLWNMRWLRATTAQGSDTIIDVVQRKRLRYRLPLRTAPFAIAYLVGAEAGLELGSVVRITHAEGTGASGWIGRDVRVTKVQPDLNGWLTQFEGYDLQLIYDGLTDSVAPTWQSTGIQKDTIVSLQERVTTTQADVSTVQAEIVTIDARVTELERGILKVLTSDPASPADDTAWFFRDGATPESLILKVRRAGATVPFNLGTFES